MYSWYMQRSRQHAPSFTNQHNHRRPEHRTHRRSYKRNPFAQPGTVTNRVRDIPLLIRAVLKLNYFMVGTTLILQQREAPMGSPASPALCSMVVSVEEQAWYLTFQHLLQVQNLHAMLHCACAAFSSAHGCEQAMSSSSYEDSCRDTHHGVSACSSSHSATPADLCQQDGENITHGMGEKGAQLMLQQHFHHYGALTVSEPQKWKQPIINALRSKSFNDGSTFFLEKVRTPFREEFMTFLLLST